MPIYEFGQDYIATLTKTTFSALGIHERRDLQRLLRESIQVIAPETMVIAEEFGDWEDSRRRIDLLGVDREANLVVIELKRTKDGGHMELQALRYAAMVSTMTFDQAVVGYESFLRRIGQDEADARARLLNFLGWDEPDHDRFARDVKIVLASTEFSRELTTAVLWLNERDVDICCVRLQPYDLSGRVLVDVQQIIPPPEAAEYQVRVREKIEESVRPEPAGLIIRNLISGSVGANFLVNPSAGAILRTFKYLVESGVAPHEVAKRCGPRAGRTLMSVEGVVGSQEFVRLATAARSLEVKSFDPSRYFCADDDLISVEDRTYAFSNQWGGSDWFEAMIGLRGGFPDRAIHFLPVE